MTRARDPEAGVSLVEILVVLAIVGVVGGVSVLGLGAANRGARAEAEARRLADRLGLAVDEVLVTGVPMALAWDPQGYRFLSWDAGGADWGASAQPVLAAAHRLPAGLALEDADGGDGPPILITADFAQPPARLTIGGAATDWQVGFDGFAALAEAAP